MELETPIVDNNNISIVNKIKHFIKAVYLTGLLSIWPEEY